MKNSLKNIGLTNNEVMVYEILLEIGLTTTKAVIEKTRLHRQLVYNALESLIEKGLVSYVIQANKKHFKANNPDALLSILEVEKQNMVEKEKEIKKLISHLKTKQVKIEKQEATIFQGNKGIKSLLDDMIKEGKEILTIGASDIKAKAFKYHLQFNLPLFHKIREKKRISYRILLSEDMKQRVKELNKLKHTKAKVLPKEFTSNSSTNIYRDKVSTIMWGEEPFGFLIKSKNITNAQRKHFELLWKTAKP